MRGHAFCAEFLRSDQYYGSNPLLAGRLDCDETRVKARRFRQQRLSHALVPEGTRLAWHHTQISTHLTWSYTDLQMLLLKTDFLTYEHAT